MFWGGQPIQLVGYSYYGLLGDSGFEPAAFLDNLAAHNINFTRFFLVLPWAVEPGPNILPFAKIAGKYDLRRFNEGFFNRLRSVVKKAEDVGIICQVCLFDRCGLSTDDDRAWPNNPYNTACNINGILQGREGGYPPFCHTEGIIGEINAAFIGKVVKTIGDCNNVIYEIMNEPNPQLGPLPQWHAWVARELRKNLAPASGSRVLASCGAYDDDEIDLFAMHRAGSGPHVKAALQQSRNLQKAVILSDDGDMECMFRPEVTLASARRALKLGQHFEHLAFTLTLQREEEKRPGARLDQMPGLCRLNLRALAELSTPVLARPFVRKGCVHEKDGQCRLSAHIGNVKKAVRIVGEISADRGKTWSEIPLQLDKTLVTSGPLPADRHKTNLARVMCIGNRLRQWPGPAYPYGMANRWSVQLGKEVIEDGLLRIRPNRPDGKTRPTVRNNLPCYEVDQRGRGNYAYFRLEDKFTKGTPPAGVTITIEFHDQSAGAQLVLEYDGKAGAYTAATFAALKDTGKWKTAEFRLKDALFSGRQNDGADFRFYLREASAPLALRSASVRAHSR